MNQTTTTRRREEIKKAIKAAEAVEILVATNEGTYGEAEAARLTGTGAKQGYRIYERVGDHRRRVQGDCKPEDGLGYMRYINTAQMTVARRELARLKKDLAAS